jgi:hypothetical protein
MRKTNIAAIAVVAMASGLAAASLAMAQPAPAAPPAPQIVRGVVTAVGDDKLTLKGRDGKAVVVNLTKTWSVQVTKPIKSSDIQPGSFIGTAEMPQADGSGKSLEVHVFPPGVKMGEGHYGWDLKKGSMMTNGTVNKVAASHKGRALDVTYFTETRHIEVPPKTPIVLITRGERGLVQPGVKVFLVVASTPNGLMSSGVAVGENGKAPPM